MKTTIKILGKGGDGIQALAGIIGEAAVLEKKNCSFYPVYDAIVRGGVSNAYITINDDKILNPVVEKIDIIIDLNDNNETLKIGDEIAKNKKLLGMFFLGAIIAKLLKKESLITAIKNNIAEEYHFQSMKAFEAGVIAETTEK